MSVQTAPLTVSLVPSVVCWNEAGATAGLLGICELPPEQGVLAQCAAAVPSHGDAALSAAPMAAAGALLGLMGGTLVLHQNAPSWEISLHQCGKQW